MNPDPLQPLVGTLQFEQQRQEMAIELAHAVAQTKSDARLQATQLLHSLLDSEELLEPVRIALVKEERRRNPIDILSYLNDLQSNIAYLRLPAKRLHDAKVGIIRYLQDIGFADFCPNVFQGYGERIAQLDRIDPLMLFFNQKYKTEFLPFQIAVQQGLIENEIDYYRWMHNGKPMKFEWGTRWIQKQTALSNLHPVYPAHWESDASFRPNALAPSPQMMILGGQQ